MGSLGAVGNRQDRGNQPINRRFRRAEDLAEPLERRHLARRLVEVGDADAGFAPALAEPPTPPRVLDSARALWNDRVAARGTGGADAEHI